MNKCLFLYLVCLLYLTSVAGETAAARFDKIWKAKKTACEKASCSHLLPDENYNCINECTSPKCYAEFYADNPLEDGEIDNARNKKFVNCLRTEVRASRWKKNNSIKESTSPLDTSGEPTTEDNSLSDEYSASSYSESDGSDGDMNSNDE